MEYELGVKCWRGCAERGMHNVSTNEHVQYEQGASSSFCNVSTNEHVQYEQGASSSFCTTQI